MRQIIKKGRTASVSQALAGCVEAEVGPALEREANGQRQTPGVRLVQLDGRVQAVEVTCRCGDVSVLEIEYEQ